MTTSDVPRRALAQASIASLPAAVGASAMIPGDAAATSDGAPAVGRQVDAVFVQIMARHDTTVRMLRDWTAIPSIAAEDIGYRQGAEYVARPAREAGFQRVEVIPTKGKPGVFATPDVGAATPQVSAAMPTFRIGCVRCRTIAEATSRAVVARPCA